MARGGGGHTVQNDDEKLALSFSGQALSGVKGLPMKCTVLQAWDTKQNEDRPEIAIAISKGVVIALAAFLTALLWSGIIKVSLWATGMTIGMEWFACVICLIFGAAWLVLNVVAGRLGPSEEVGPQLVRPPVSVVDLV